MLPRLSPLRILAVLSGFASLIACDERLVRELPLPEVSTARGLVFILEPEGGAHVVVAVDLEQGTGREALPTLQDHAPRIELTALYFDDAPVALGLSPGRVETPARLSAVFQRGYRATLREEDAPSGARVIWSPEWEEIREEQQLSATAKRTLYAHCRFIESADGRVCLPNLVCDGSACARDFCWGEPRPVAGLDAPTSADTQVTPVVENGETWLYFVTDRFYEGPERCEDGNVPCNHHARVRLRRPDEAELSTLERLPTGDFEGKGWSGTPHVTNGGREMFFQSSRDDAEWWDEEIYLSTRNGAGEAWGPPVLAVDLQKDPMYASSVLRPVLLPDRKSLALRQDNIRWAVIYRRRSTAPGDANFEYLGRILTYEGIGDEWQLWPTSVSSDGRHLFYIRRERDKGDDATHEARVAEMADLTDDLVTFQRPRTLALPEGTHADRRGLLSVAEHPNGQHVYFSDFLDTYVADAVPCE